MKNSMDPQEKITKTATYDNNNNVVTETYTLEVAVVRWC